MNDRNKNIKKKVSDFSVPDYQPPLPPFFFFCGAFLRVAPEAAGFCCRGGTTLLAGAVEDPDVEPGLGEVGGLLAVLLASLGKKKTKDRNPSGTVLILGAFGA